MSETLPEYPADIKEAADDAQVILLNPQAAIQKAVAGFNTKQGAQYQIVTRELDVMTQDFAGENVLVRVQKAEDLEGRIPLYFGAIVNQWHTVYITDGLLDFIKWEDYKFPQT